MSWFVDHLPLLGVAGLAGFVLAATLAAMLFETRPFLGMTQHWGLQLGWLALIGQATAVWIDAGWAIFTCSFCLVYWVLRIWRRADTPEAAQKLLRLMSANVGGYFNPALDRLPQALAAADADVIVLIEVTPDCHDRMRSMAASYPHAADTCALDPTGFYGIQVLSRFPLTVLSRGAGADAAPRHLSVRLQLDGKTVDLIAVHLTNPTRWRRARRIPGEVQDLIAQAERGGADLILCGDCNAAGWSGWLRQLESATGLRNTRRLLPSWPVALPLPFRLPIDHIWARNRAVVQAVRLGPRNGSDHFPLLAEIGWREQP